MGKKISWFFALTVSVLLVTSTAPLYPQRLNDAAALPTDSWLKSGGNFFNQNYSPLTQIIARMSLI
jgi:hypothetical protein